MKKLIPLLFVLTLLFTLCACTDSAQEKSDAKTEPPENSAQTLSTAQEELLKNAQETAKIVAEHTLHYRQYDIIPYVALDADTMAQNHPMGESMYQDGKVVWDGIEFESFIDFYKAYQEKRAYKYDSFTVSVTDASVTEDTDALIAAAVRNELVGWRDEEITESMNDYKAFLEDTYVFEKVSCGAVVNLKLSYTQSGTEHTATMVVYLLNISGEWKCISPTSIGMQAGMYGPFYRYINTEK